MVPYCDFTCWNFLFMHLYPSLELAPGVMGAFFQYQTPSCRWPNQEKSVSMFTVLMVPITCISFCICSLVHMFCSTFVSWYLCFPVPMISGICSPLLVLLVHMFSATCYPAHLFLGAYVFQGSRSITPRGDTYPPRTPGFNNNLMMNENSAECRHGTGKQRSYFGTWVSFPSSCSPVQYMHCHAE